MDAKHIEPGACPGTGADEMSLRSIAISLKRIADRLDSTLAPTAIEGMAHRAGYYFEQGRLSGTRR